MTTAAVACIYMSVSRNSSLEISCQLYFEDIMQGADDDVPPSRARFLRLSGIEVVVIIDMAGHVAI